MDAPDEQLSLQDVRRVAALSRLALSDDELERSRVQLAAVLGHMRSLRELDLSSVEPLANPGDPVDRWDADEPGAVLPTSAFMAIAPAADPPFLRVPKVLGEAT